ncbi:MAG: hypothetical protein LBU08_02960 [Tannerellaceae bacterium]|nr:hypothetical protein [Tannerellaceae bacterium]
MCLCGPRRGVGLRFVLEDIVGECEGRGAIEVFDELKEGFGEGSPLCGKLFFDFVISSEEIGGGFFDAISVTEDEIVEEPVAGLDIDAVIGLSG